MSNADEVKGRSEILFLYDTTNANPNGDPDTNEPRVDAVTNINIVSDVRLKRTIRDYLHDRGQNVFVRAETDEDGNRVSKKTMIERALKEHRASASKNDAFTKKEIEDTVKEFIDIRLFGATIAIPKPTKSNKKKDKGKELSAEETDETSDTEDSGVNSISLTGPVQFKFGHSLHTVQSVLMRGTTVFPSKEGNETGTFTEFSYLPYSMIAFYGIVNENAGKYTGLKEKDVEYLLDSIWNGTKGLITRSKFGQFPRLLLQISYNRPFHIGSLDSMVRLIDSSGNPIDSKGGIDGKKLRSTSDYRIDVTELFDAIARNFDKITSISLRTDDRSQYSVEGKLVTGEELIESLNGGRFPRFEKIKGKVQRLNDVSYPSPSQGNLGSVTSDAPHGE